jgi:hypothetical protein
MYGSNPYAQAGWANPNPLAVGRLSSWDSQQVSPTFGALPANTAVQSPNIMTFRFSGPDTLNCSVIGPKNEGLMRISTSMGQQRVTSFTGANGATFANVEWALQPLITVSGLVPRQEAMKWLLFSADRRYVSEKVTVVRMLIAIFNHRSAGMTIGQDMYIWLFQGQSIYVWHFL